MEFRVAVWVYVIGGGVILLVRNSFFWLGVVGFLLFFWSVGLSFFGSVGGT